MMRNCEDCGGPIRGTNAEIVAMNNGLLVCEDCIDSYEQEAGVYDEMLFGYRCSMQRLVDQATSSPTGRPS